MSLKHEQACQEMLLERERERERESETEDSFKLNFIFTKCPYQVDKSKLDYCTYKCLAKIPS